MNIKDLKDKFTVYVFCDGSVSAEEREMLVRAMEAAATLFGCWFYMPADGDWGDFSADAVVSRAPVNSRGQLGASEILTMMKAAFKAKNLKGAMFIFTGKDLYLKDTWCFGAARVGGGVSVQSMARFRELAPADKQAVISRTLRHELGHIHRLAADHERRNIEKKYGWHCTSPGCTMRQSPTLKALLEHVAEEDPGNCLCELCREDLERFKQKYY